MRTVLKYCRTCRAMHEDGCPAEEPIEDKRYDPSAGYDEFLSGPRSGTFQKCASCGGLHEISAWPHNCLPPDYDLRSDLAAPMVVSDSLEAMAGSLNGMKSMADGKFYTSKAKYRADLRARGYVEVGNDPARLRPSKKVRADEKKIRAAAERAVSKIGLGA